MNISVLGTGNIGATLIKYFAKAGHRVMMANRGDLDTIKTLSTQTGATGVAIEESLMMQMF